MKHKLVFFFLLLGMILTLFFYKDRLFCSRLSCISLEGIGEFKAQEIYEENDRVFRALFSSDKEKMRVKVISNTRKEPARQNITAEISRAKGLYADAPAPYPGAVSDKIVCAKEFIPIFGKESINGTEVSYFTGFMTERLTFGACAENEAFYRGLFMIFYCSGQKKIYQLEVIVTKEEYLVDPNAYEEIVQSVTCGG